ncbi:MAG: DUF4465 domain-containing protein [Thermoguttaceae bacterium]
MAPIFLAGDGLWFSTATAQAVEIDFEDLTLTPNSVWSGVDPTFNDGAGVNDSFISHGAVFGNYHEHAQSTWPPYGEYHSWNGWAYSNQTHNPADYMEGDYTPGDGSNGNPNPVPVGVPGQFHAVAGAGAGGSANYGVAFPGWVTLPTITLPAGGQLEGAHFTNVNFAYYSMLEGDSFAKVFTEADQDWFRMTVTGKAVGGGLLGSVPVYLADLRDANSRPDNERKDPYILKDWTYFDLSSLSEAATLEFEFLSSDIGLFGMNTPSYVAIDNIVVVPEPSTIALIGIGVCCGLVWWRRGRKK